MRFLLPQVTHKILQLMSKEGSLQPTLLVLCMLIISSLQIIGVINCMIKRPTDGKLIGYNVDYVGAIAAIEECLRGFHCILKAL